MFIFLVSYLLSAIITVYVLQKFKYRTYPLTKLRLTKSGIGFYSTKRHKIKIYNFKIITIKDGVCIKTEHELIALKNIKNVLLRKEYLYFCGCGKVEFVFNCVNFYRYFNIRISSNDFDFEELKECAMIDLINNCFDVNKADNFKKFINFIKNTLKINLNNESVSVSANKTPFSYQITYKLNNKIKKINVLNSIGKN